MNTILIASGDIFRRRYIKRLFEKSYRVDISSRKEEAIDQLIKGEIDLLILDGKLEVGESLSIIHWIFDTRRSIPIIMLVQSLHSPLAQGAEEIGVLKVIKIPFEDHELTYWVREGLKEDQRKPEIESPPGLLLCSVERQLSGIVTVDQDGIIIAINESAQRALGLSDKRLLFQTADAIGPELSNIILRARNEHRLIKDLEYINPVNNHSLLLSISILRGEQQELVWTNLIIRDLSQPEIVPGSAVVSF
jgi:DNA-binding response OmpR family regulator